MGRSRFESRSDGSSCRHRQVNIAAKGGRILPRYKIWLDRDVAKSLVVHYAEFLAPKRVIIVVIARGRLWPAAVLARWASPHSPSGFRGKNCEENIDDCPGNLCLNGATCVDDVNRYSCVCPPTYTGELCEQDVDECAHRPSVCQNGATCTNSIGGYSCICVNGWTGPDCSVNIDDCAGAACFNGATCIDRVGSFYCRCTPGKTGLLCHLDDACTSNPCHADAICDTSPINGSYTCSCASGYKGVDCSEDIDECEQGTSFRILLHTLNIDEGRSKMVVGSCL
uniref:EGF-like domain-containing protein n=1 Tax=Timema genevievae TaxID=629358 RepID=A0A7R9JYL2_TIMGE|nr:unnamed protein product [Timema genevievae]